MSRRVAPGTAVPAIRGYERAIGYLNLSSIGAIMRPVLVNITPLDVAWRSWFEK